MANRWENNGNSGRLFSWAPKSLQMVTVAMKLKDTCSLQRKAMTILDSILKSRDITLSTKVHLVKATVFPVVMYGYESWSIKKAECWRIDAFELWCWRRLLSPIPVADSFWCLAKLIQCFRFKKKKINIPVQSDTFQLNFNHPLAQS